VFVMQKIKRDGHMMNRVIRIVNALGPISLRKIIEVWPEYRKPAVDRAAQNNPPQVNQLAQIMKVDPRFKRTHIPRPLNCYVYEVV